MIRFVLVLSWFALFCVCSSNVSAAVRQHDVEVPTSDDAGGTVQMHVRICEPEVSTPVPVLLFVHGDPGDQDRPKSEAPGCNTEVVDWFVRRGFAFVFPLRLGFGATGGPFLEGNGQCSEADYIRNGREIARQTATVARYLSNRTDMDAKRIVVLGHSAGGWGAIAYDSTDHPGVVGFINMAGGKGGNNGGVKNQICRMDQLSAATSVFGASAKTPMLWIYAENDSFFGPEFARALLTRFTDAGGVATLLQLDNIGADGHMLLFAHGGSKYWGPHFAEFLTSLGFHISTDAKRAAKSS